MKFLLNSWYVAAWSDEVTNASLLARKLLGRDVVLYRLSNGTIAALEDRCAHRFAPLHAGRLVGDSVQCPYHGLEFSSVGVCVRNPHGNRAIPSNARVRSFATFEQDGAVWIWMGDQTPDPTQLPDISHLSDPQRSSTRGYLTVGGNYGLVIDNLMDLTHGLYLHAGTLVTVDMIDVLRVSVKQQGRDVEFRMSALDVPPPAMHAAFLKRAVDRVDMVITIRWSPASYLHFHSTINPTGCSDPTEAAAGVSSHLITPRDDLSTHYFYGATRDRLLDPERVAAWQAALRHAFRTQDAPMIRMQQERIGAADLMELQPALLSTDAGPVRVRRVLAKMIQAERDGRSVAGTQR